MAFGSTSSKRVALFIDGANVYSTCKNIRMEMDWRKVRSYFDSKYDLIRAYYYTAIDEDQSDLRPLIDYLEYNGYTLRLKAMKKYTDDEGRQKIKGNMDLEMALDMLSAAQWCSDIFIFTGDGDFEIVVDHIQGMGCRVHAVSALKPIQMISDDLRRSCDSFIDLNDMTEHFSRGKR